MKSTLTYLLVVGVPGLCFVIAGTLSHEYPVAALGGMLIIGLGYGLSRKHVAMIDNSDQKRQGLSFILAGIIGASFAITGLLEHQYLLAAAGSVILIGALVRLYGRTLAKQ